MQQSYSSKERMMAALECQTPDYVPLCFMIFSALRRASRDPLNFVGRQLDLGLDAIVDLRFLSYVPSEDQSELTGLPLRFHPDVEVPQSVLEDPSERYPLLVKEYHTTAGTLSTIVKKSRDWPYGNFVPFLDDYLIPRSAKFLVESEKDLPALEYLLQGPSGDDITLFREYSAKCKKFADSRGLLLARGWGAGMETACWLCGIENLVMKTFDDPGFVERLGELLHRWNKERMEIMLEAVIDLFFRRWWYENALFFSPQLFKRFISPGLARDADMVHQAGGKFAYIMTTASMPLVEFMIDAGVDALVGVDPVQDNSMCLSEMKRVAAGRICLWGGVNGFVTVERGTPEDVAKAVATALEKLGPDGFILSPVDNVRDDSEKAWRNVMAMIRAWQQLRSCSC